MDARSIAQRIVAAFVIIMMAGGNVAGAVRTYSWSGSLPIPAASEPESHLGKGNMADAIIEITDHLTIHDLDIRINLAHEGLYDLQIILQSPAMTNVVLNLADNTAFLTTDKDGWSTVLGGSGWIAFDDEAVLPIEQATDPFTGSFRPASTYQLSEFDGQDAYGSWHLKISDIYDDHTGTLNDFEIAISVPEPATAMFLMFGISAMTLLRHRKTR